MHICVHIPYWGEPERAPQQRVGNEFPVSCLPVVSLAFICDNLCMKPVTTIAITCVHIHCTCSFGVFNLPLGLFRKSTIKRNKEVEDSAERSELASQRVQDRELQARGRAGELAEQKEQRLAKQRVRDRTHLAGDELVLSSYLNVLRPSYLAYLW